MAIERTLPRPIIVDTDGGIDDAAALWWALTDPRLELIAVTTVAGVVSAAEAARNVRTVLRAAGRDDVPIGVGADTRSGPVPTLRSTDFIHGADGLGNTLEPGPVPGSSEDGEATDLLRRLCGERSGEVCVVSIGPLTNLARTIAADPSWAASVRGLIAMAGSARSGGNALPNAEFNVAADPVAAATVVAASWREPPLMIGLDVTHVATLTQQEFDLLAQHRTPAARYLDAPLRFYRRFGSTFTGPNCPCHDLVAVMAAGHDELILDAPLLPLAIDLGQGPAWGSTIVDFRGPAIRRATGEALEVPEHFFPWRIALGVDVDAFRGNVRRLFSGS